MGTLQQQQPGSGTTLNPATVSATTTFNESKTAGAFNFNASGATKTNTESIAPSFNFTNAISITLPSSPNNSEICVVKDAPDDSFNGIYEKVLDKEYEGGLYYLKRKQKNEVASSSINIKEETEEEKKEETKEGEKKIKSTT